LDANILKIEALVEQARQFSSAQASREWSAMLDYVVEAGNERKNQVFSVDEYSPAPLVDDPHLFSLFDVYLQAALF